MDDVQTNRPPLKRSNSKASSILSIETVRIIAFVLNTYKARYQRRKTRSTSILQPWFIEDKKL